MSLRMAWDGRKAYGYGFDPTSPSAVKSISSSPRALSVSFNRTRSSSRIEVSCPSSRSSYSDNISKTSYDWRVGRASALSTMPSNDPNLLFNLIGKLRGS